MPDLHLCALSMSGLCPVSVVNANGNSLPKVSIFFHDVSGEFPSVSMRRKGSRASAGCGLTKAASQKIGRELEAFKSGSER